MKRLLISLAAAFAAFFSATADPIDELLPVRGLAIEAPSSRGLNDFLKFIEGDLVPAHFNLLILRVDWNYAYETHPELRDEHPLTKEDVKRIVAVCRNRGIRLVPQINLLGHQSWAKQTHALLREYPEFDETPSVKYGLAQSGGPVLQELLPVASGRAQGRFRCGGRALRRL